MQRVGAASVLTKEEEDFLVQWLRSCLDRGFPRQDSNLVNEVQKILNADGRENPFTDNKPGNIIVKLTLILFSAENLKISGQTWLRLFFKRNSELSNHQPEALGKHRDVTEQNIRAWFQSTHDYLRDHHC